MNYHVWLKTHRPVKITQQDKTNSINLFIIVILGYAGNPFIWYNKRKKENVIFVKLHRAFANYLWLNLYPNFILANLSISKLELSYFIEFISVYFSY